MRANALDRALPAIAGFFTDRTGIEIVRGHHAATDNKVIYLPQRRSELDLSEKDLVENVAYLYHEGAGHMLHSNFALSATNPLQRAITGTLEDIRIENLVMAKFPGARRYLSRLTEIMVQEGAEGRRGFPLLNGEESEASILQRYILYRLRHEVLRQQPMQGVAENALSVASSKLPAGMLTRLDALMFQVTDCASEDEVFQLADAIIDMIKEEKEKEDERKKQKEEQKQQQEQENQQQQADDPQPGQPGSDEGDGEDDGTEDEAGSASSEKTDSESEAGNQSESSKDAQSEAGNDTDSTQTAGSGDAIEEENAAQALSNILDMSENDVEEDLGEMLQAALNAAAVNEPRSGVCIPMPNNFKANIPTVNVDLAMIRGSINAVRTRTLQWMESVSEDDVVHSRSGMQIDSSRIWSGRLGGSVFVRKDEGIDLNAAVSIVVDRSGSMMDIIGKAAQAAVATMLAFDVPGIKTQVMVFPWHENNQEGVSVIKRWQESPRQLAGKVSNLTVDGSTPMAEAILYAASDISRRDESLRIVLVVTDGDPDDADAARHVIERARESGITVVALGIGVDPSSVFSEKYAAMIKDVGELSSSMVRLVKTAFEDRRTLQ